MAKAIKLIEGEQCPVPARTALVRILEDVTSNARDSKKLRYYAKAGDVVGLISSSAHVLLVVGGFSYSYEANGRLVRSKATGISFPSSTFPVNVAQTNFMNRDAPLRSAKTVKEAPLIGPNKRPSYGAPRASKRRK